MYFDTTIEILSINRAKNSIGMADETVTVVATAKAYVTVTSNSRQTQGNDGVRQDLLCYCEAVPGITADNLVRYAGSVYEITGAAYAPGLHHLELELMRRQ